MSESLPAIVTVELSVTPGPVTGADRAMEGQGVRLTLRTRDAATRALVAATGVRILARAPSADVPTSYAADEMEAVRTGELALDLVLDEPGRWRFRAECTGPRPAAAEVSFDVRRTGVLVAEPPDVLLTTPEGEVIGTPDGAALTARRMDRLTPLATPADDDLLPAVRDGVPGTLRWGALRDEATAAGTAAGTTAGAEAGAEAGTAAGTTAGTAAGTTAGAAAGAEVAQPIADDAGASAHAAHLSATQAAGAAATAVQAADEAALLVAGAEVAAASAGAVAGAAAGATAGAAAGATAGAAAAAPFAAAAAASAADAALAASLVGSFATKAAADAAIGNYEEGDSVETPNDPDPLLRRRWTKQGDVWVDTGPTVASIAGRLTTLEGAVTVTGGEARIDNLKVGGDQIIVAGAAPEGIAAARVDKYGRLLMAVTADGSVEIPHLQSANADVEALDAVRGDFGVLAVGDDIEITPGVVEGAAKLTVDRYRRVISEVTEDGETLIPGFESGGGGAATTFSVAEIAAFDGQALAHSTAVRARPVPECMLPPGQLLQFIGLGQSGMRTTEAWPALTTTPLLDGVWMLGGAPRCEPEKGPGSLAYNQVGTPGLQPAICVVTDNESGAILTPEQVAALEPGNNFAGEAPIVSAAYWFRQMWLAHQRKSADPDCEFVVTDASSGGKVIEVFQPGYVPEVWNRVPSAATQVKAAATALGKSYAVGAFAFCQGESNSGDSVEYYSGQLIALGEAFQSLIVQGIGGQSRRVAMFLGQLHSRELNWASYTASVGEAQRRVADMGIGWFLWGAPYAYPDKGSHLDSNGARWFGLMLAKAMFRVLALGLAWVPLQVYRVVVRGTQLLVMFDVPCPPIRIGTAYLGYVLKTIADYPSAGLYVRDSIGAVDILSVEVVGQATLLCTLARELGEEGRSLSYATPATGGVGLIEDSDSAIPPFNYEYVEGSGQYAEANIADLVGRPYSTANRAVLCNEIPVVRA